MEVLLSIAYGVFYYAVFLWTLSDGASRAADKLGVPQGLLFWANHALALFVIAVFFS